MEPPSNHDLSTLSNLSCLTSFVAPLLTIRTIFGTARRPRTRRQSSVIEAVIETPTFDLTVFKLHFGRLTGNAYTKDERVLRFEAIAHNTAELRCGRMIQKFPEIVTKLAEVVERFATALDCVDTGFLND